MTAAAQVRPLPMRDSMAERVSRPAQYTRVARKNRVHIHMMADWLDSRNFSQNALWPRASSPWYRLMPSSATVADKGKNQRQDFQNQPSATSPTAEPARMACS